MLYILSIANTTPDAIAPALAGAGLAGTIIPTLGVCAPWPNETGVTVLISTTGAKGSIIANHTRRKVVTFAADWCAAHGEACAALTVTPATFELVNASAPKPE